MDYCQSFAFVYTKPNNVCQTLDVNTKSEYNPFFHKQELISAVIGVVVVFAIAVVIQKTFPIANRMEIGIYKFSMMLRILFGRWSGVGRWEERSGEHSP